MKKKIPKKIQIATNNNTQIITDPVAKSLIIRKEGDFKGTEIFQKEEGAQNQKKIEFDVNKISEGSIK